MMLMRVLLLLGCVVFVGEISEAQVSAPQHESRLRHIFGPHIDTNNLEERFSNLKCALVLIESGNRLGTGFYISKDGDIATASHVLADRTFDHGPNNAIVVTMAVPEKMFITNSKGERTEIAASAIEVNPDAWLADVARVKTGKQTNCWLREADDMKSVPGEHLITMGFPGLSFQTLTLYVGIMSARLKTNLPTVVLRTGEAVQSPNEFIRVQMPISSGLSGAPIIDDQNRAIGVVTNAGGWSQDLEHLLLAFRAGAFQAPPVAPNPQQPPNSVSFSLNSMAVTAELAALFHDFASPGYGDAVPLRYLRKPLPQNQPSASHGH